MKIVDTLRGTKKYSAMREKTYTRWVWNEELQDDQLVDYANRSGAPEDVIENLEELEEEGEVYESIEDIWPDYPTKDDFFFNEEEY